ncbi:hypothetical protein PINS_up008854 [Pythium insidiosum]|nr:hypothetical protein PINS_up008854 [Pythium insidiosum]
MRGWCWRPTTLLLMFVLLLVASALSWTTAQLDPSDIDENPSDLIPIFDPRGGAEDEAPTTEPPTPSPLPPKPTPSTQVPRPKVTPVPVLTPTPKLSPVPTMLSVAPIALAPSPRVSPAAARLCGPAITGAHGCVHAASLVSNDDASCGPDNAFGSMPVSVAREGTFCAVPPICSGDVQGNCPDVQPGLLRASRCVLLNSTSIVYGCVSQRVT